MYSKTDNEPLDDKCQHSIARPLPSSVYIHARVHVYKSDVQNLDDNAPTCVCVSWSVCMYACTYACKPSTKDAYVRLHLVGHSLPQLPPLLCALYRIRLMILNLLVHLILNNSEQSYMHIRWGPNGWKAPYARGPCAQSHTGTPRRLNQHLQRIC